MLLTQARKLIWPIAKPKSTGRLSVWKKAQTTLAKKKTDLIKELKKSRQGW